MARKKQEERRGGREFTPEFKADVVRLCETGSEKVPELCRRMDLNESVVPRWIRRVRADEAELATDATGSNEREELSRLRWGVKQLQQEASDSKR